MKSLSSSPLSLKKSYLIRERRFSSSVKSKCWVINSWIWLLLCCVCCFFTDLFQYEMMLFHLWRGKPLQPRQQQPPNKRKNVARRCQSWISLSHTHTHTHTSNHNLFTFIFILYIVVVFTFSLVFSLTHTNINWQIRCVKAFWHQYYAHFLNLFKSLALFFLFRSLLLTSTRTTHLLCLLLSLFLSINFSRSIICLRYNQYSIYFWFFPLTTKTWLTQYFHWCWI